MFDKDILNTEELRFLADIGGAALKCKMPELAESICRSLLPFCPPNSNGPVIGVAMGLFGQSKAEEAVALLKEKALVDDPKCADSHAHLALILRATGKKDESDFYLQSAVEQCVDSSLSDLIYRIEEGFFDNNLLQAR